MRALVKIVTLLAALALASAERAAARPAPLRAERAGARAVAQLVGTDGRPFRPLGENRFNVYDPSWSDGLDAEGYVARMASDGMNALRVFVVTGCGRPGTERRPGCLEPELGKFDEVAARQYDAVFAAAERHGVKVVLSIFAIGFTPGDVWKGWEQNPYSTARGGPARTPEDFFTDGAAREAARRRLRYVMARWGASPAFLAVDLLNEPEWDGNVPEDAWIPWAKDLARTWRAEDRHGVLVTAGPVGLHWNVQRDERPWWSSPECEIVQWHRYGKDVYDVHALARALVRTVRDTARAGKPVLIGEFGYGGEAKPLYDHTHVGIWTSTFAGAGVLSHSAPVFTVDSDEPMTPERARHFRTLAAFLRRADGREALAPGPDAAATLPGTRALTLRGEDTVALWVHAPRRGYGRPVRGLGVSLSGLAAGRWRVIWIDDVSGEELGRDERRVGATGRLVVPAPPFVRHAAAILERVSWPGSRGDAPPRSALEGRRLPGSARAPVGERASDAVAIADDETRTRAHSLGEVFERQRVAAGLAGARGSVSSRAGPAGRRVPARPEGRDPTVPERVTARAPSKLPG